jgi:hypothetical protein
VQTVPSFKKNNIIPCVKKEVIFSGRPEAAGLNLLYGLGRKARPQAQLPIIKKKGS